MILRINSKYQKIYGFSSIWGKYVSGFDNTKHCINCLIGERNWEIKKDIQTNTDIIIPLKQNEVLYICGVTYPYEWRNNLHIVVKGKDGNNAEYTDFNGVKWQLLDAEKVYFDDKPAKEKYKHLDYKFTSCRNFQFGVYYFEHLKTSNKKPQIDLF